MTVSPKVHVFTDVPEEVFLKQAPRNSSNVRQVSFTFGTTVSDDADVLICFNRASYTIKTHVPKDRTVFIAAEPDAHLTRHQCCPLRLRKPEGLAIFGQKYREGRISTPAILKIFPVPAENGGHIEVILNRIIS